MIISIQTCITVQIRYYTVMGKTVIYARFAGKVTSNLCGAGWLFYLSTCQIRADDSSSTCVFTTGKSYLWNIRNNNIVFACYNYTVHVP
jgi:hypothetical protein